MCHYFTKNIQHLAGLNPVGFDEKSDRLLEHVKARRIEQMRSLVQPIRQAA